MADLLSFYAPYGLCTMYTHILAILYTPFESKRALCILYGRFKGANLQFTCHLLIPFEQINGIFAFTYINVQYSSCMHIRAYIYRIHICRSLSHSLYHCWSVYWSVLKKSRCAISSESHRIWIIIVLRMATGFCMLIQFQQETLVPFNVRVFCVHQSLFNGMLWHFFFLLRFIRFVFLSLCDSLLFFFQPPPSTVWIFRKLFHSV